MKTTILKIMAVIFLSGIVLNSNAGSVPSKSSNSLSKELGKIISYPESAVKNNLEGSVCVSFKLNEEGKVVINEITATNSEFKNYVENKLQNTTFKNINDLIGFDMIYRFNFRKE